jgi:hypothetical protein
MLDIDVVISSGAVDDDEAAAGTTEDSTGSMKLLMVGWAVLVE